jgi:hypothetical protein
MPPFATSFARFRHRQISARGSAALDHPFAGFQGSGFSKGEEINTPRRVPVHP